ncbi:MAG: MFS transporter, partial [Desulfuromonadales bacterium]
VKGGGVERTCTGIMLMRDLLKQHGRLAGFVILNMTNGTAVGLLYMTLPLFALSIQATSAQIGMIRGASGLGLLLLVIPVGFLVDRFGPKKLFLIGNFGVVLVIFLVSSISIPSLLILLMFLEGISRSLKFTSISAAFFESLHQFGLEKSGWYKGSLSIGLTFIGPALGGVLLGILPFKPLFMLVIALMLLPSLLIFFIHTEPARQQPTEGFATEVRSQMQEFAAIIRHRGLFRALSAEVLCAACLSTFTTFIVVLVVREWHLKPGAASLLLTLEGGAFILTVFGAGHLVKKHGQRNSYLLSITIAVVGLVGLTLAQGITFLLFSSLLLGFGLGLINIITSSCAGIMKGEKGKVASLFAAAAGLGISFGPLVSGLVAQYLGVQAVFIAMAPLLILLGFSVYRGEPERCATLNKNALAFLPPFQGEGRGGDGVDG